MLIPFLICKIHRATITSTDLNYQGSISIDQEIIRKAGLRPLQKVEIYDIDNGNRFQTYVLASPPGSGEFMINGAAARLVHRGDKIIIAAYGLIPEKELDSHRATILLMKENNEIERIVYESI